MLLIGRGEARIPRRLLLANKMAQFIVADEQALLDLPQALGLANRATEHGIESYGRADANLDTREINCSSRAAKAAPALDNCSIPSSTSSVAYQASGGTAKSLRKLDAPRAATIPVPLHGAGFVQIECIA